MDQRYSNLLNQINALRDTVLGLGGGSSGLSIVGSEKKIVDTLTGAGNPVSDVITISADGDYLLKLNCVYYSGHASTSAFFIYKNGVAITGLTDVYNSNGSDSIVGRNYRHYENILRNLVTGDTIQIKLDCSNPVTDILIKTLISPIASLNVSQETIDTSGGGGA
jgi:hypothetical protein